MKKFVAFKAKTYLSYLKDTNDEDKKEKGTKKFVKKENLNLKIIKVVQKQLKLKIK